jgi:hypothetical protein
MNEAVQWLLKAIPTYVLTFGRVFVAPKTEIIKKCREAESELPGALIFLGVSQLILFPLAQGSEPHSDFWSTVLRAVSFGLISGLATLGVLALAWRIMGVRFDFSKLLVAYCYISGVSSVIASVLSLASAGIFATYYPETYRAMMSIGTPMGTTPSKYTESMTALQAKPGYLLFAVMSLIAWSVALLWLFFAWGVFRNLASVSRLRSAVAGAIFVLLWVPMAWLLGSAIMLSVTEGQPVK